MTDVPQYLSLIADNAFLIGVVLIAVGFLLSMAGRAMTVLALAAGIGATTFVTSTEWMRNHDLTLTLFIVAGGAIVSILVAIVVKLGTVAVEFFLFLVAWFLLLYGWAGLSYLSAPVGAALWIVAAIASTFFAERAARSLPGRGRIPAVAPRTKRA